MSDLSPTGYLISGGCGGALYVLSSHPFDTVKVLMQTSDKKSPSGNKMIYHLKNTIKHEGILGLYRGMGAALMTIVPNYSTAFLGFGIGMYVFGSHEVGIKNTYMQYFLAGCFSSFASTPVVAPGERIKCLLQVQMSEQGLSTGSKKYKGPYDCIKKLYKEGGLNNIFRGFTCTLVRDISNGWYFLTYEATIDYLTDYGARPPVLLETVMAGSISGVVYWIYAMPFDVIKTIYQTAPPGQYKQGTAGIFLTMLREKGIKSLFRGFLPVLLTAVPANAACFVGFEQCRDFILPWFHVIPEEHK